MSLIKIEPALKDMIHSLGADPETEAVKIFNYSYTVQRATSRKNCE